jgi:hypothetical protein
MWCPKKIEYRDSEQNVLSIEEHNGGVVLEAKDGSLFETMEAFLEFADQLKQQAEALFSET